MTNVQRHAYLRRLPAAYYRGRACIHWSLTIEDRKTGWLTSIFHSKSRELLTHTAFRFGFCCPIYCCMPDHIHLLWCGITPQCDQRSAIRFFRRQLNMVLETVQARLQRQAYDHVLRDEERDRSALEEVAEYIARNPERKGLVPPDEFARYPYMNCLVPGYPELWLFEEGHWDRFWRIYSHLLKHGLSAKP